MVNYSIGNKTALQSINFAEMHHIDKPDVQKKVQY